MISSKDEITCAAFVLLCCVGGDGCDCHLCVCVCVCVCVVRTVCTNVFVLSWVCPMLFILHSPCLPRCSVLSLLMYPLELARQITLIDHGQCVHLRSPHAHNRTTLARLLKCMCMYSTVHGCGACTYMGIWGQCAILAVS